MSLKLLPKSARNPVTTPKTGLDIHYTRGPQIGEPGHFGHCIEVTRKSDGKQFACKVIQKSRFLAHGGLEQFRKEVEVMSRLRHPNTINFEDYLEDDEHIYLVMEKCTGGELFTHIRNHGAYSEQVAAYLMRQLVSAVHHLHKHDIMHCDIKPDNILFLYPPEREESLSEGKTSEAPSQQSEKKATDDSEPTGSRVTSMSSPTLTHNPGTLKLVDYGLAKWVRRGRFFTRFCGTLMYAAPEVHRGAFCTASDMWSLGVVLFVMVYGFAPFQPMGSYANEPIEKIVCAGFHPQVLKGYGPWFPASMPRSSECRDLISRLLERDPAVRITAAEALMHPWLTSAPVAKCPFDPLLLSSIKRFQANSLLKMQLIRLFSKYVLSDTDIETLRDQFKRMDTDGDGYITAQEIFSVAKAVSLLLPEGQEAAKSLQEESDRLKRRVQANLQLIENAPTLMNGEGSDEVDATSSTNSNDVREDTEVLGRKRRASLANVLSAAAMTAAAVTAAVNGPKQPDTQFKGELSAALEGAHPGLKRVKTSEIADQGVDSASPDTLEAASHPLDTEHAGDESSSMSSFARRASLRPSWGRKTSLPMLETKESDTPSLVDLWTPTNSVESVPSLDKFSLGGLSRAAMPIVERIVSSGTAAMHEPLRDLIGWTVRASLEDAEAIVKRLDSDGDGKLTFDEVIAAAVHAKLMAKEERLWKIFRAMDTDNDGALSTEEIKQALLGCGMTLKTKVKRRIRKSTLRHLEAKTIDEGDESGSQSSEDSVDSEDSERKRETGKAREMDDDEEVMYSHRHPHRRRSSLGLTKQAALESIAMSASLPATIPPGILANLSSCERYESIGEDFNPDDWIEYEEDITEQEVFGPYLNERGLVQYERFLDLMEFVDFDLANVLQSDLGL